ncbi:MAG: hypothetical protein PHN90_11415 [Methanothrix sp.]|nr:hypothetical protein [Methanothrix sp.]HNR58086.1 hypothetical protein [Methanothrix sp.]HOI69105.1 hypothetical protein [Methanothrix sp.]HPY72903.1 hypothetical protein [Methanothrix sp.]HQA62352.1 hypothetical protein [Methanothrix sp.]
MEEATTKSEMNSASPGEPSSSPAATFDAISSNSGPASSVLWRR